VIYSVNVVSDDDDLVSMHLLNRKNENITWLRAVRLQVECRMENLSLKSKSPKNMAIQALFALAG